MYILSGSASSWPGRSWASQPSSIGGQVPAGPSSPLDLDGLRQRIHSGEATPEELVQLRQQLLGQQDFGGGRGRITGRGGLTGTIERVDGDSVTVNTVQGVLRVTIGSDTTVQTTVELLPEELEEGSRVAINSARDGDGVLQATTIVLIPEGTDGFGGGGFPGGNILSAE